MERWLREEVVPTYERVKSGQEPTRPAAEVFADLWKHHRQCRQEQGSGGTP